MKVFLQGNEACARAALAAGCRFYGGYPITPSSEIAEFMARQLPQVGGTFIQMEDEMASIAACIGASVTGTKALTATSGPGFSLMQENLGYACLAEIPLVVIDAQRVGPSTGMPTLPSQGDVMQARWGTHGDHPMIVLTPSSVAEYFELTQTAFSVSESLRTPVVILADEVVSHLRELVDVPAPGTVTNRPEPTKTVDSYEPYHIAEPDDIPEMAPFGSAYRFHITGLYHNEDGSPSNDPHQAEFLIRRLERKMQRPELVMVKRYELDDADIAVVAYGTPVRAGLSAVRRARDQGIRAGLLQLSCVWPFPDTVIKELCQTAKTIIMPEMNLGQLVREVERAAAGQIPVHSLTRSGGEIFTPQEILDALLSLSEERGHVKSAFSRNAYNSRHEIRLAGTGGQGLVLAGIILSEAAGLYENQFVVQTQVYGPESRGGASRSDVITSSEEIDYPRATNPEGLLVMSQDAYHQFHRHLAANAVVIYDEDLVRVNTDSQQRLVGLPLTRTARQEFGKVIVATMIGLGAIAALTGVVTQYALEQAVASRAPKGTQEMNQAAVRRGFEMASAIPPVNIPWRVAQMP